MKKLNSVKGRKQKEKDRGELDSVYIYINDNDLNFKIIMDGTIY